MRCALQLLGITVATLLAGASPALAQTTISAGSISGGYSSPTGGIGAPPSQSGSGQLSPTLGSARGIVTPTIVQQPVMLPVTPTTTVQQQTVNLPIITNTDFKAVNFGVPTDRINKVWYYLQPATNSAPVPTKLAPVVSISKHDTAGYSVRHSGEAKYTETDATHLSITSGNAVVIAHKTITVSCGDITITQQPDTITQFIVTPNTVLIRALLDDRAEAIQIALKDGEKFSLAISCEICIGKNEDAVNKALKDSLPRSNVVMTQLKDGSTISTSSFLLPSLTAQDSVLLSMYRKGVDRALVTKLLKTAAILQVTSYNRSAYRPMDQVAEH